MLKDIFKVMSENYFEFGILILSQTNFKNEGTIRHFRNSGTWKDSEINS